MLRSDVLIKAIKSSNTSEYFDLPKIIYLKENNALIVLFPYMVACYKRGDVESIKVALENEFKIKLKDNIFYYDVTSKKPIEKNFNDLDVAKTFIKKFALREDWEKYDLVPFEDTNLIIRDDIMLYNILYTKVFKHKEQYHYFNKEFIDLTINLTNSNLKHHLIEYTNDGISKFYYLYQCLDTVTKSCFMVLPCRLDKKEKFLRAINIVKNRQKIEI